MVRSFDGNDIRAEVWTQQQAQRLDSVGSLRLASGETQLSELLVWLQHDHVRAKHHARFLLLVVVDLHRSVVRDTECDHLSLVSLGRSGAA